MAASPFSALVPELVAAVADHVPLPYRPQTLLALALTSRGLSEIVVPHVLYRDVKLAGEAQAKEALKRLIEEARKCDGSGAEVSKGQCIRRLLLVAEKAHPKLEKNEEPNVLQLLHTLVSAGGLPNLRSLWIDLSETWQGIICLGERFSFPDLGDAFWADLRVRCQSLQEVRIANLDGRRFRDEEHSTAPVALLAFKITSIRLQGYSVCKGFFFEAANTLGATGLAERLEVLELRDGPEVDDIGVVIKPCTLCNVHMPRLRVLIIEGAGYRLSATDMYAFWERHRLLERVEMRRGEEPAWFKGFAAGLLPNLTALKIPAPMAPLILPFVAPQLVMLDLYDTQGAQGAYFLRTSTPGGTFPQLRSLGIQLIGTHPFDGPAPGNLWSEHTGDPSGLQVFGAEYLASIARAAPRLEELELFGSSADDLASLTRGLLAMPALRHFGFSSPEEDYTGQPFFVASRLWSGKDTDALEYSLSTYLVRAPAYAPTSFEQAARDVLEACAHLETVSCISQMGEWLKTDRTARAVRGEGTLRTVMGRCRGRVIGSEEEW